MDVTTIAMNMFPGIASFFTQDPVIAGARVVLIILGFILAYYGFKRTLEPLIMVPMGIAVSRNSVPRTGAARWRGAVSSNTAKGRITRRSSAEM